MSGCFPVGDYPLTSGYCNTSFCGCDCHKTWGCTLPPTCRCNCRSTSATFVVPASSPSKNETELKAIWMILADIQSSITKINEKLNILESK